MDDPITAEFIHYLDAEIKVATETLPKSSDWADFRKRCGRIEGLTKALRVYGELRVKHLAEDEDEDEDDDKDEV